MNASRKPALLLAITMTLGLSTLAAGQEQSVDKDSLALIVKAREAFSRKASAPAISDVVLPAGPLKCFDKIEVRFRLDASYENPFDPEDIDVGGEIAAPDGHRVTIPAFYFIPYTPANGLTQLAGGTEYRPAGRPCWMFRFAASSPGTYRLTLQARQRDGRKAVSEGHVLHVQPQSHRGYVQESTRNPAYFENSGDGTLFWPTGANVAWTHEAGRGTPYACYEYYFALGRGRMNATRVWMCHWSWLEWTPRDRPATCWTGYAGLGYYNQMVSAAFDRIFSLAEQYDLRIMLTTDDNDEQGRGDGGWTANPYNVRVGGVCRTPDEFWSSPAARTAYRNRLRYILARWGYSTSLWAINSWNDCSRASPEGVSWLKEMHDYCHAVTRDWRPLIVGTNFRFDAEAFEDYLQFQNRLAGTKPSLIQECWYLDDPRWFVSTVHDELWNGLARGVSGVMTWLHTSVDKYNAWDEFRSIRQFAERLPLHRENWKPLRAEVVAAKMAHQPEQLKTMIGVYSIGDITWGMKAPVERFAVDTESPNQFLAGFGHVLYGHNKDRQPWRTTPTLEIDIPPRGGELILQLGTIGSGRNRLEVRRNDQQALTAEFSDGPRELAQNERWLRVPLPAGRQQVTLANEGHDSLSIQACYFGLNTDRVQGLVRAQGLGDGRGGFLWIQNLTASYLSQELLGQKHQPVHDVRITLAGMDQGEYSIEYGDTRGGIIRPRNLTSRNGTLELPIESLDRDLAIRFTRRND